MTGSSPRKTNLAPNRLPSQGFLARSLLAALALLTFATPGSAALEPDEIAILAIRTSRQSRELAEYYAKARGIPRGQICLLDAKAGESMSRADWELRVRPAIRKWLATNELEAKIRCFVTVWDVPLKIEGLEANNAALADVRKHLAAQKATRQELLQHLTEELDGIFPAGTLPHREFPPIGGPQKPFSELVEAALQEAQGRMRQALERKDPQFFATGQKFEKLFRQGGGTTAVARRIQSQVQANPAAADLQRIFEFHRGELAGLRAGQVSLLGLRETRERDQQLLTLIQQGEGLVGALRWIEDHEELWRKNETYASFDSELALLLLPSHALLRWLDNPLHYGYDPQIRAGMPWTMMVARLEAPTFEQAKQLVDASIDVEKTGLAGRFYIDARGMGADKTPGSYGDYDQSLRDLAKLLKDHTKLDVVLDDTGELFRAGDCPDAALYCGWYSLSKYVDAFKWKRGSVAYHIASGEAETLRNAGSNCWCKSMLERGVCATLGPTYEPYLMAFPRPLDFFPLLLTGQYTLAETYARTNPYNSWVMTLVGDPLYNPFKGRPQFDLKKLPPEVERVMR